MELNLTKRIIKKENVCQIEGCNTKIIRGKYCSKHYHQLQRYGYIKNRTRFDKNEIIVEENFAKILLYDYNSNIIGYTIISKEDIEKIRNYKISFNGQYATIIIKGKTNLLHRFLTNCPKDKIVDHINNDKLDNRRENMRIVTRTINNYNRKNKTHMSNGEELPIGIRKHIQKNNNISYQAYCSLNKKQINIGYFKNKEDAIKARNDYIKKYNLE